MAGKTKPRGNPNGNPQNLTPFNKMDAETKRKIQSMGGKAGAKSKRERKAFKEAILEALKGEIDKDHTVQDVGVESLLIKFMAGDLKAFEIVRDTVGEKPTDKQEVKVVDTDWFV